MPDGVQEPDMSLTGNSGEHRSNLKRKAKCIARSLAEVLAYLTFNTSSLNESNRLLYIITNVSSIRPQTWLNVFCQLYVLYISFFITFLRSWIFNQPIFNIRHFAQCQSMCDAQCCREIILFSKNHLQKVQNICYFLVIVPLVTVAVACSLWWESSPWFLLDTPNRCYDTKRRKTAVSRQTIHYIQAWNGDSTPNGSSFWQSKFWHGFSICIACR